MRVDVLQSVTIDAHANTRLAAIALALAIAGCTNSEAMSEGSAPPQLPVLLTSSADFGIVVPGGGSNERIVRIRNDSEEAVCISRWTTSCECLSVGPHPLTLGPHESALVRLRYDTEKEPEFAGSLLISVDAYSNEEHVAAWTVPISVVKSAGLEHLEARLD